MLDHVVEQADAQEVRDRIVVVHADLGRAEWPEARQFALRQALSYGVRFEVVRRRQGDLLEHVRRRRRWPSPACRWCTSDHKRAPVSTLFTRLAAELRDGGTQRPARILNCMGLRAEESPARRKKPAFSPDERASNSRRWVDTWLPIHDWTEEEVWERIRQAGTPTHWAYSKGMGRLSCCFCIYAPRPALLIAAQENPALFEEYVQVETEIGHRFRQDLSLAELRAALDRGEQPGRVTGAWNM